MSENRSSPRHRTFKGGSISYGAAPSVDCIVRNISQSGACIEVANNAAVPDRFTLLIKPELLKRSCEVAWREPTRIGVRFR